MGSLAFRRVAFLLLFVILPTLAHAGTYEDVAFTDAEEAAVLAMANQATLVQLTTGMGQTSTAANNVIAARPIGTMAQLAAVPYVGTAALGKFKAYVPTWTGSTAPPPPPPPTPTATGGTYDGVVFSAAEEATAVSICNTATLEQVKAGGVTATPAGILVNNRPWANLKAVADFSGIGASTMTALRNMVPSWSGTVTPPPPPPATTGGTFDGVVFTADEEARALDICNKAGYSQMSSITGTARNIIYDSRPWSSLAAVSGTPNIGATAMKALKNMAATWTIGTSGRIDTVRMLKTSPPALNTGVRIPRCRIVSASVGGNYIVIADATEMDYTNPTNTIKAYVPSTAPIASTDPVHQWYLSKMQVSVYATYLALPTGSGEKNLRWSNVFSTKVNLP